METPEKYSPFDRLVGLLKPDKREVRNVYIYAVFSGIVSLSLPLGIQAIINLIQGGQISTSWIILVILVVGGVALNGIFQILQLRITENLQQNIFTRSAFEFAYRIPRIKLEELYKHYAPELMNRFFDTITVQKGLSKLLIEFSSAALSVIFGLLLLSFYHPFFLIFSLILLMLIAGIFQFTATKGMDTSLKESKHKYRVAHWLEEIARTGTTFKLAGLSELSLHKTDDLVQDYVKAREGHFKILLQQYSMLVVFKVLVALGLLALGGILVMEQLMNVGQFVASEIIILLVMSSVEKMVLSLESIYDVLTSLEKIGAVLDMKLEDKEGEKIDIHEKEGIAVDLVKVGFRYPGEFDKVLNDFSLVVKPGEKVAITGQAGSGKSSLLHILAGLYDVTSGNVAFDGFPKGDLDLLTLRTAIGDFMAQEQIFEGTVEENISLGRDGATREDIKWAVENVKLKNDFKSVDLEYKTLLDPLGKKLPKSVAVKILLARSVVIRPRLLLIEGNLEFVDETEKKEIIDFLVSPENPWTLIVATTDPYFLSKVNTVVELTEGELTNLKTNSKLN
ncbi:MAG: peptidase domain-containing ABC transporter [Salibacteraceae bacterium]